MTRTGKYIEYDFPLYEVNRLAVREGNAKKPIYRMHKWWARRLSCVFRTILLASAIDWEDWDRLENWRKNDSGQFVDGDENPITDESRYHLRARDTRANAEWHSKTGGLISRRPTTWERLYYRLDDEANAVIEKAFKGKSVLDPFMGGGTTIVEALRLGATAIGVDLNPVAWFTVKKETDGCDLQALEAAFRQVEADVAEEIRQYYKTTCPCCQEQADVMYVFWVKEAKCNAMDCGVTVPLFNSFELARRSPGKTRDAEVPSNDAGEPGMVHVDGPERGLNVLVCPRCEFLYASKEERGRSICPNCKHEYDPTNGYTSGGNFTCWNCGTADKVLDAAQRDDGLALRMFALELHCPHCGYKGYKKADENDHALYERASDRFKAEEQSLNIPDQPIPPGYNTYIGNPLPEHGYRYWRDMFNSRQLLSLSRLRDSILKIDDMNLREYLLIAWSASIEYSSMFVSYQTGSGKTRGTFSTHAYVPKTTPSEGNVWGASFGRNTFEKEVELVRKGIEWLAAPYDNFYVTDDRIDQVKIPDAQELTGKTQLFQGSSEDLSRLNSTQVDWVVTDPPYLGNVMYAELADYFYVWLRTALADDLPGIFGPELTPKAEEVVETVTRGHGAPFLTKDHAFFEAGLTRIFAEAGSHLADDGLLAFTFHHQANEAWGSVLRTVLDAGYFITAVYPVQAEMLSSLHIQDKANISYDAVIVCRKQTQVPVRANWLDLEDLIYLKARDFVDMLDDPHRRLTPEDIYVITIGQCLEIYSRHYHQGQSYAYRGDHAVSIDEALDGNEFSGIRGIAEIVDQLVEISEGRSWPSGLDPITRFWVVNFLGQSDIAYDRLKRRLTNNPNITIADLETRKLIETKGSKVRMLSPSDRQEYLREEFGGIDWENNLEQTTLPGFDLVASPDVLQVDQLHYLFALIRAGKSAARIAVRWGRENPTLLPLVEAIVQQLDSKHKHYRTYRQIQELLSGTPKQQEF